MAEIRIEELTAQAFAPFGDVLEAEGPFRAINAGLCRRYHDLAQLDFDAAGRAGISVFAAEPRALPYQFDLIERHPHGAQGINLHRGIWHGVLTPVQRPGGPQSALFAVVDRIGPGGNLEEFRYPSPWIVEAQGIAQSRADTPPATPRGA